MLDLERSYHWFWCGNECEALLYGPFRTRDDALANIEAGVQIDCEQDHIPFRSTTAQILRAMPAPSHHADNYYLGGWSSICRSGNEVWRYCTYESLLALPEGYEFGLWLLELLNDRPAAAAPRTVEDDLPTLQRSAGSRG